MRPHRDDQLLAWAKNRAEMTEVRDLHKKWTKDRKYRKAYEDLEEEFAGAKAGIARLDSGKLEPSTTTLQNPVRVIGTRLEIRLVSE